MTNTKAQVGDLIRVLPDAHAVKQGWALPGEIVEVIYVASDSSGVDAKGKLDPEIPLEEHEYVIHRKADEESACDNCGKQGVHTCRGAEYHAEQDAVNSPNHYTQGKFETIEVIEHLTSKYDDGFTAHCVGTAFKYMDRAPYKHESPTECLRKAAKYLEFAIEYLDAKSTQ